VSDPDDDYRPIPRNRRWQIAVLGVGTAIGIVLLLLYPPGGVKRVRKLPPDAARCAASQTTDCVGGTVNVIVAPSAGAASAPR
jgi:hypothetical protein